MKMKETLCNGIVALLAITSISTNFTTTIAYADEAEIELKQEVTSDEDMINLLDEYITVTEDGLFELNAPESIIDYVGEDYYASLLDGVDNVNDMALEGEVEITENGSVYETDDNDLVVQGGGVDKVKTYWWGERRWACTKCANKIANDLNKVSTGAWGISAIAGILGGPVGIGAGIGSAIGAVRAGWMSGDISYYNSKTKRGVIIDCRWILTYKVKCQ